MTKPFAWSYSVLSSYEDCPRRHYLTKVAKTVKEPQSEEMLWGNRVHKALENKLLYDTQLPDSMVEYAPLAEKVKTSATGGRLEAEQKMALTKDYEPCTFFDKDVWVRGITDFTVIKGKGAFIGDWKTGKPTPASAQLKLTAAMTMHHLPYVERVATSFIWLKTGGTTTEQYTREDIPGIWQHFEPRVRRLEDALDADHFPPKPSGLCKKWCPVGKSNCEFCGL